MRRIGLAVVLILSLLAAPLIAGAQQVGKLHLIGYLSSGVSPSPSLIQAFREGLQELGYVEGRNITIESRFGGQLRSLANELVQLKAEVIVASGGPAVRAVQQATTTIPIVMAFSGDPVGKRTVREVQEKVAPRRAGIRRTCRSRSSAARR